MSFKDHFSAHAGDYARYRPVYPDALFDYLAGLSPSRRLAWDCGTGNGQAARALAAHFHEVFATDASAEQIDRAHGPANVRYQVSPAERCDLQGGTVDLITVAQAFHWFEQPQFLAEADRVLRPGGILALWSYGLTRVEPGVDRLVEYFYQHVVGDYWPPERRQVESGYADVRLPFPALAPPSFAMTAHWTLNELCGYLDTWSASQRYRAATGRDPLQDVGQALSRAWGDPARRRPVAWPVSLRVARKPDLCPA